MSVRLLIDQYINYGKNGTKIGVIDTQTDPYEVLKNAIDDSEYVCNLNYGLSPHVNIERISDTKVCYIPSHLYHVLFEIIKNAMRATMENKKEEINIVISGDDDIIIKISDNGKGIRYSDIDKIWYYSYTSISKNFYNNEDFSKKYPMAGFGFGLPISRSITNFLGGDIKLMSLVDYGTDVYISLPKEK